MNKLGKYDIRRTLGKGAMGIVYEGFDPVIERTVAIKTILPSQLNSAEVMGVMARFKREAQAAGRLNHPGIVAIYDYGEEVAQEISADDATMMAPSPQAKPAERVAYIAMEFVKGRELRDFFEKGERFAMPEVVRIMGEILDALDHAHSQGVVHRDMKPANLIVLGNGHIKIADFGIARVEASELTQTGTVMGTPSYMSPEQFMGHPVDGRSDLFSCGVILYQLLTGEKPFTGESTTTVMYKVLREDPVPPSQLNLTLAPALDAVVKKALAKNPSERFQSGREFAQALKAAVESPSMLSLPDVVVAAPPGASAAAPKAAPKPADESPRSARIPGLWAAVAASVVALGAGIYMVVAPNQAAPTMPSPVATAPAPAAAPAPVAVAPAAPALEPGTMVISALGLAGNAAEARNSAHQQLIEKALALYVDKASLDSNRALLEKKLLSNSGAFIRTVLQEGAPGDAKGGIVETQTRAVVNLRDVQKSLNQLSREERVEFIRNKGDPRISIRIDIASNDANIPRERSQLAENIVKDRIKSFGFRVWSLESDNPGAAGAQPADFAIRGEVKLKQLSTKLPASGLTITKTAITSWTLKAVETASGEEVYLSTKLPTGKTWASEEQALSEIGQLVGDEFSRNFFLQHFSFRTQRTTLIFTGLPEGAGPLMLRELRGMRAVLDAQSLAEAGRFQLQLPETGSADVVADAIVKPLNMKLGRDCFAQGASNGAEVTVAYSPACATPEMRTKMEAGPPAGWPAPPSTPAPRAATRNSA
jgi:serine/threonine-protein kinase